MTAPSGFEERYAEALDHYAESRDETALSAAYELGRSAVRQGLSVLDLAAAHNAKVVSLVADDGEAAVAAAGEFFIEALSAFELVQRVLQETRDRAAAERRQAAVLRQLSTFLGDASISLDASSSLAEMLQLVAEHAREVIGAGRCLARLDLDDGATHLEAQAVDGGESAVSGGADLEALFQAVAPPAGAVRMTGAELERHPARDALQPLGDASGEASGWLAAPLTTLDGRTLGLVQLFGKYDGEFSELDEAVLVQLTQMASAAVERTLLYRGSAG